MCLRMCACHRLAHRWATTKQPRCGTWAMVRACSPRYAACRSLVTGRKAQPPCHLVCTQSSKHLARQCRSLAPRIPADTCRVCNGSFGRADMLRCRACAWSFHSFCLRKQPTARKAGRGAASESASAAWLCDLCKFSAQARPGGCQLCGRDDRHQDMLLCDGCDGEFHMDCQTPPVPSVPEGQWFCGACCSARRVCCVCAKHGSDQGLFSCCVCQRLLHVACDTNGAGLERAHAHGVAMCCSQCSTMPDAACIAAPASASGVPTSWSVKSRTTEDLEVR